MRTFAKLLLAGAIGFPAPARLVEKVPDSARQKQNPFERDQQAARAGAKLYARECSSCHGNLRQGHRAAPPLTGFQGQSDSAGALFWVLRNGSLRTGMPSFAHLPAQQRWQIITFLTSPDR